MPIGSSHNEKGISPLVAADIRGAGTRDERLRTSAWEATGSNISKLA